MDTQNCTITISAIESTEKKIILKDGNLKYHFWLKKKDGADTKANQQFQQFRFATGDVVEAAVKIEPKTFVNEKGKTINFTDRNIAFFLVQDNVPKSPTSPPEAPPRPETPSSEQSALKSHLQQLETRIRVLEDWKDKQPCYILTDGKWEIVPGCFNGEEEIKAEDLV